MRIPTINEKNKWFGDAIELSLKGATLWIMFISILILVGAGVAQLPIESQFYRTLVEFFLYISTYIFVLAAGFQFAFKADTGHNFSTLFDNISFMFQLKTIFHTGVGQLITLFLVFVIATILSVPMFLPKTVSTQPADVIIAGVGYLKGIFILVSTHAFYHSGAALLYAVSNPKTLASALKNHKSNSVSNTLAIYKETIKSSINTVALVVVCFVALVIPITLVVLVPWLFSYIYIVGKAFYIAPDNS